MAVLTATPLAAHQRFSIAAALSFIILGTMRSAISTTVSVTPRLSRLSRMMQPMKPAPISTTSEPCFARLAMARASASVQQWCTPGRSSPGTRGLIGVAPVAISSLSNPRLPPPSRTISRFFADTLLTRSCR